MVLVLVNGQQNDDRKGKLIFISYQALYRATRPPVMEVLCRLCICSCLAGESPSNIGSLAADQCARGALGPLPGGSQHHLHASARHPLDSKYRCLGRRDHQTLQPGGVSYLENITPSICQVEYSSPLGRCPCCPYSPYVTMYQLYSA